VEGSFDLLQRGSLELPSPIVHSFAGYLVYRIARQPLSPLAAQQGKRLPLLFVVTLFFSLLPDVDSVLGVTSGDFGKYHNNGTHSLVFGAVIALFAAWLFWLRGRLPFVPMFVALYLSYALHVILDYFTWGGRGVMLLWPLTAQRFDSPVKLFYGVRWSEGLLAAEHLMTLATELGFVLAVLLLLRALQSLRRPERESEQL
jgi:inner membrane protein